MVVSMSRKGNCWDNAVMASFFGSRHARNASAGASIPLMNTPDARSLSTWKSIIIGKDVIRALGMSVHSRMNRWQSSEQEKILTFYVYHDRIRTLTLRDVETSLVLSVPTGKDSTKTGQGQPVLARLRRFTAPAQKRPDCAQSWRKLPSTSSCRFLRQFWQIALQIRRGPLPVA